MVSVLKYTGVLKLRYLFLYSAYYAWRNGLL